MTNQFSETFRKSGSEIVVYLNELNPNSSLNNGTLFLSTVRVYSILGSYVPVGCNWYLVLMYLFSGTCPNTVHWDTVSHMTKMCPIFQPTSNNPALNRRDEGSIMHCLIEIRMNKPESMNEKCLMVVEQWQIISLKDWRFSPKFKSACKEDVKKLCIK